MERCEQSNEYNTPIINTTRYEQQNDLLIFRPRIDYLQSWTMRHFAVTLHSSQRSHSKFGLLLQEYRRVLFSNKENLRRCTEMNKEQLQVSIYCLAPNNQNRSRRVWIYTESSSEEKTPFGACSYVTSVFFVLIDPYQPQLHKNEENFV